MELSGPRLQVITTKSALSDAMGRAAPAPRRAPRTRAPSPTRACRQGCRDRPRARHARGLLVAVSEQVVHAAVDVVMDLAVDEQR
jgi:hypothetical protein